MKPFITANGLLFAAKASQSFETWAYPHVGQAETGSQQLIEGRQLRCAAVAKDKTLEKSSQKPGLDHCSSSHTDHKYNVSCSRRPGTTPLSKLSSIVSPEGQK